MTAPKHPLAEVFGYPPADASSLAQRHRHQRLCPHNNKTPSCTKDKAQDPLGVCSVYHQGEPAITCPVRFRQGWLIASDAADFFFPAGANWTRLTEVRLKDAAGRSVGNIDVVLCAYNEAGKVYDFGALEIQAVYISGNIRNPFAHFMSNPAQHANMDWTNQASYPRPDYLSSSRKRLAPQLLFKGGIFHAWKKKTVVAVDHTFFATLPPLPRVPKEQSDLAFFVYKLQSAAPGILPYELVLSEKVFTQFESALPILTTPRVGKVDAFLHELQSKVDEKLEAAPSNQLIESPLPK